MLDALRDRLAAYLAAHDLCVVSAGGAAGISAVPARYWTSAPATTGHALEVDCLLPRWSDVAYLVEQDGRVVLIVAETRGDGPRWLQYRGTARLARLPNWGSAPIAVGRPEDLRDRYVVIHVTPERIDLVDERRGWGARETLEL